jgi:hypothetical protein
MLKTHYLVALFRKNASRSNQNRIQIPDAATGADAFALTHVRIAASLLIFIGATESNSPQLIPKLAHLRSDPGFY